ncbi:hypothetical protein [Buchananella hordeovulneris]|uniref:hypothetical protein n=1 Tax=Buchananella hordeovulneris TaxID=52770 RepID=UPI0026DBFFB4|nr:hypothetical protein [Buchananella hordeovulneris]MDO5081746.1 hypothetical protein [Buchananella hordeovulneris]
MRRLIKRSRHRAELTVILLSAVGDYAPLRFAIAREVGRFALGHHGRWRQLWTFLPSVTPVVRGVLARVEGYSADRAGALLQGDAAGDYLTLVAGSKILWAVLRPQALVAQTSQRDLSTWAAIFTAAVAPVAWRAAALADVVGAQLPGDRRGVIQLTYHRFQGDLAAACQAGAAGRTRRPRGGIFRPPHLPR